MRMRVRTTRDPISNQAGSSSTGGLPGELWVQVNPKVSPDRASARRHARSGVSGARTDDLGPRRTPRGIPPFARTSLADGPTDAGGAARPGNAECPRRSEGIPDVVTPAGFEPALPP